MRADAGNCRLTRLLTGSFAWSAALGECPGREPLAETPAAVLVSAE
jgi:hypothetical protein